MPTFAPRSIYPIARPERTLLLVRWFLLACSKFIERFPIKHRGTQLAIDSVAAASAVLVAYQIRFDFSVPSHYVRGMWFWTLTMAAVRPATLWTFTGYKNIWRFLQVQDLTNVVLASLPPSLLLLMLHFSFQQTSWAADVPGGVVTLEFATFAGLAAAIRGLRRAAYEESRLSTTQQKRALILGTEETLASALAQARVFPEVDVIGLIAAGRHLVGRRIGRVPIIGEPGELGLLLRSSAVDVILIADASLDSLAETASTATQFGTDVRLLPSAANVMRGEVRIDTPVQPDRVFGDRAMVGPPPDLLLSTYRDQVVLITGAGGSIGSELARQVLLLDASVLLLLDNDENSIFEAERELATLRAGCEIFPMVGDIRDERLVRNLFQKRRPDIVLHAAAYKHVPIMEANASEAFLNNVIGTRTLAEAALEFGAKRFLMISTDKAVQPTSVMGATKRIAEMLIENRAHWSQTRFACVRFGNVAGSRGSVIPIFLKQIAEQRPVTITDERMSRYFMTIEEAIQLVLQASSLDGGGDIFMLDMGDPVMITSLARKLIEMSSLRPEKDVPIEFVGIRPGEKLQETPWLDRSQLRPTALPRVYSVASASLPQDLEAAVMELEHLAAERRDMEMISKMRELPIEYTPSREAKGSAGLRR